MTKLFLNGKQVYEMNWGAQTPAPWGPTRARVVVGFNPREGTRSGHKAHVLVVRRSKLEVVQ